MHTVPQSVSITVHNQAKRQTVLKVSHKLDVFGFAIVPSKEEVIEKVSKLFSSLNFNGNLRTDFSA